MAETDLSTWLPIGEAAHLIGCSTRTVERLGRARKLEQRLRRQEGTPPVAVYNPDDVQRIASERRRAPAPFVLPAGPALGNGNGHGRSLSIAPEHGKSLAHPEADDDPIRLFCAAMVRVLQSPPVAAMAASRGGEPAPAYVGRAEALMIAGVSDHQLRRAVQAGEVQRRGRRYRRTDLEQL